MNRREEPDPIPTARVEPKGLGERVERAGARTRHQARRVSAAVRAAEFGGGAVAIAFALLVIWNAVARFEERDRDEGAERVKQHQDRRVHPAAIDFRSPDAGVSPGDAGGEGAAP